MQEQYTPTLLHKIRDLGPRVIALYVGFQLARFLVGQPVIAQTEPRKCGHEHYYGSGIALGPEGYTNIAGYTFANKDTFLLHLFTDIRNGRIIPLKGDERSKGTTSYAGPSYPVKVIKVKAYTLGNPLDDRELIDSLQQLDTNKDCNMTGVELKKGLEKFFK